MLIADKWTWSVDLTGGSIRLEEFLGVWSTVATINFTGFFFFDKDSTLSTADSIFLKIENELNTAPGIHNTYEFSPIDAADDVFGRQDYRVQLKATSGGNPFRVIDIVPASPILTKLGADDNSDIYSALGAIVFPNSYAGSWMVPERHLEDARKYPHIDAGISVAQDNTLSIIERQNSPRRVHKYEGLAGSLLFKDRRFEERYRETGHLASEYDQYASIEIMWEEAVRQGASIRYYFGIDTQSLDGGNYDLVRVLDRGVIMNMEEMVVDITNVMGRDYYTLEFRTVVVQQGEFQYANAGPPPTPPTPPTPCPSCDEERFGLTTWPGGYHTRLSITSSPIPDGANNPQTIQILIDAHTRFPITPSPIPDGADNPQTIEISVNYT